MDLPALIARYCRRGILVDANLLIIYLIGLYDERQLINCRATKNAGRKDVFGRSEFRILAVFLSHFERIVTTPHLLTEVSNLGGALPAKLHAPFRESFARMVQPMMEQTIPSRDLCARPEFVRFGLADTAIATLAPDNFLVITDEFALSGLLQHRGVDVIPFDRLRLAAQL